MPGRRDGAQPVAEHSLPHTIALPLRSPRARLLGTAGLVLIVGLPLFLSAPFLDNPFERDEGVYATVAQGLLSGETPYRDLFDNKPPLVYVWYALSFLVFGEEVFAPRLFAAVLLAGTALVVFLQARLLFPLRVAYMSAGLFALAMGIPYVALHANTEALMMLPLMGSLLAFTRGMIRGRLAWFALAGVLAGLALMTKQVAVWNLLTLLVIAPWWRRKQGYTGTEAVLPDLWLGAGALAASALVLVPFALSGALDDFFYANVIYNYGYVGVTSYAERIFRMKRALLFALYFLGATAPLVAGSFAGIIASVRKGLSPAYLLAIVWAVASGLGVAMGGRFYPHYFLQLIPSMALLSALALHEHLEALPTRLPGRPLLAAAALLLLVALATNGLLWVAPRTAEERLSGDVYHQKEWEGASREVAEYVAARTAPEEEILNYGREGQLYFYADRLPPPVTSTTGPTGTTPERFRRRSNTCDGSRLPSSSIRSCRRFSMPRKGTPRWKSSCGNTTTSPAVWSSRTSTRAKSHNRRRACLMMSQGRKDSAIGPFGTCNCCAGWSIILPETLRRPRAGRKHPRDRPIRE